MYSDEQADAGQVTTEVRLPGDALAYQQAGDDDQECPKYKDWPRAVFAEAPGQRVAGLCHRDINYGGEEAADAT